MALQGTACSFQANSFCLDISEISRIRRRKKLRSNSEETKISRPSLASIFQYLRSKGEGYNCFIQIFLSFRRKNITSSLRCLDINSINFIFFKKYIQVPTELFPWKFSSPKEIRSWGKNCCCEAVIFADIR